MKIKLLSLILLTVSAVALTSATPLLRYNFDETSGTIVADSAGNNNATIAGTGGSIWAEGVMGNALFLTSHSRHATSANGVALSNAVGFTATAWIWLDNLPSTDQNRVILQQLDGNGTGRTLLSVRPDGALSSFAGGDTTMGGLLTTGRWYHVALTVGSGTVRLFVNGIQVASSTRTFENCSGSLRLGNHKTLNAIHQWIGGIDDFRLYTGVLDAEAIAAIVAESDVEVGAVRVNVVRNRPVRASSVLSLTRMPDYALNGNTAANSDRWSSIETSPPHWLEIDLDGHYAISGINYWTPDGSTQSGYGLPITGFQLQYWDGLQWRGIHGVSGYANNGVVSMDFPPVLATDRLRFLVTAASAGTARLIELQVMGAPHPLQATGILPAEGDPVVDINCPMSIHFNMPVDIVNASNVRVVRQSDGVQATGITVSKEGADRIRICADLQRDTTYVLRLETGAVAASEDAAILNPPVYRVFRVAAEGPEVAASARTVDPSAALVYGFDRGIELLDAAKIELLLLPEMTPVPLTGIHVAGNQLTLEHGGLAPRRHYAMRLAPGALAGVFNNTPNAAITTGHYSGEYLTLAQRSFEDGTLQGFITNTSLGIENRTRAWRVFTGDISGGPGYDFSYLATGRSYDGDFAATPALQLEAGESYTMTFAFSLDGGDLRIDLRNQPVRDVSQPRLALRTNTHGHVGVTNVPFSVEQDGTYHLVFSANSLDQGSAWLRLDNISIVRAVPPGVVLNQPIQGATFNEGDPIIVSGHAFGVSAELSTVRIFSGDRLLSEQSGPDFHYVWTDYDPGVQSIRIVARDARFQTTELIRDLTINFADGTLDTFVTYAFRTGLDGVVTSGIWNSASTGFINFNTSNLWLSTPRVFLRAGETYTFQFRARNPESAIKTLFLSAETTPGNPANPLPLASWTIASNSGDTIYSTTFTVEENAALHMTLYNLGSTNSQRLHVDDVRIIGNFNAAPTVALTQPMNGLRTIAGAPINLMATANDSDGTVERVEFWNGNLLIGTVREPPYSLRWDSAPSGTLQITALAYDNAGGVSDPAQVSIVALPNRVNIATNLGSAAHESVRAMLYQDDGTLVVAGILDPLLFSTAFPAVQPLYLAGAQPGQLGTVVRLSEDGRTLLSISVVGAAVADMARDADGNLYIAAGPSGLIKLNASASGVLWHYTSTQLGSPGKRVHRVDASPHGLVAAILSPQEEYGTQQLNAGDVALVAPDGTVQPLMAGSGGTYTTDVAVDSVRQRVWIAGWKNFVTDGDPERSNTNPVDVPILIARSLAPESYGQRIIRAWDWEANDDNGRWLNRFKNNMADTRTQRVKLAHNGDVYVGLEYDGGNTPLRDDPYDLSKTVTFVGGDAHHNNALTTTAPKIAIVRLNGDTGAFVTGQFLINRLNNGGDNTFRLEGGQLLVDSVGRVHVTGASASGLPMSFDPLPGHYSGGGGHWVLSPDLGTRELVTRWGSSGVMHAVAVSPSGKVAVGGAIHASLDSNGNATDRFYRRRSLFNERQSSSDGFWVVGDFSEYYSFQPGAHPRLLFTAEDIPALRFRATQEPFASMVTTLRESRTHNGDYFPFDETAPYDRSQRAQINAFLYVITGDETYAISAREDVEWVLSNTTMPWASPALRGLASYWMAARVALAYDWCASSPHWDDAFLYRVSKALLDIATVIIQNGGTEQNTNTSSNWQGGRGASGGLALLATDTRYDPALLDAAYSRVVNYLNASTGNHPLSRGWSTEGIGYTYYPFGIFVGPFGKAMARVDGRDLRVDTTISAAYQSLITAALSEPNILDYGGIKPDWSVDNLYIRGEGIYGQAFHYVDQDLLPAAKWIYDHLMGLNAPDRARWDDTRAGTIYSFLNYPDDVIAQSPMEFYRWQRGSVDEHGIGITTFRNAYGSANDLLAQFKVRRYVVGGHDAPDGLGFRILGMGAAWAIGGGRNEPGKRISQASLYLGDPAQHGSSDFNLLSGGFVGSPLVKADGGGHVIGFMSSNNQGVTSHKRWFVTDFDAAATGAGAVFVVADTSTDGTWWQMPTSPFNTVSVDGNTFTITAPNGASLRGTVLHPAGATLGHGTRSRGDAFDLLQGGSFADLDPVTNPLVFENKFVTVNGVGGNFLIAMTVQPAGGAQHPNATRLSGTVSDAVVQVGTRQYTFTHDNVLYDGNVYTFPAAQIVFDVGDGSIESGSALQTVAYGAAPTAPVVSAPAGQVFVGWNRRFDAVTGDLTISALYTPIQAIPDAPTFLRGTVTSAGMVTLQWNDVSVGETGFTLEESYDAGASWTVIASLPAATTSHWVGQRAPLSTFHYRVRAEGTEGPSAWSNIFSITTPTANLPPVFVSQPPTHANEGTWFTYAIEVEDPEDDEIAFNLVQAPEWLNLTITGSGTAILSGTPIHNGSSVPLLISASDGTNTPVLQSFDLTINAAPQLSLITPSVLPVLLSAGHGIYAEVLATDSHPVALEWAVVQGPEGSVLATPHSTGTTILFPRDGIYTVRVVAINAPGAVSQLQFQARIDRPMAREARQVVVFEDAHFPSDWSVTRFRNAEGTYQQHQDVNGDGSATGVRRFYPLSTQDGSGNWINPLSPSAALGIRGATIFGGIVAERNEGATASLAFTSDSGFTSSGRLKVRFQGEYGARMDAAFFWSEANFEQVGPGEYPYLGMLARLEIGRITTFDGLGQVRWLVRSGNQFYVSQRLVRNTDAERSFSGAELANAFWAHYNPAAPHALDFNQDSAVFNVTTADLGPIQAVGLYLDSDNFNPRRASMEIGLFRFTAEVGSVGRLGPAISFADVAEVEVGEPVQLVASVTVDPTVHDPAYAWSLLTGPGALTFSDATALTTMATAASAGQYALRFFVNDGDIWAFRDNAFSILPAPVPPITALQAWRIAYFGDLADHPYAAELADFDGNGIANLLEFAFGTDPTDPADAFLPILASVVQDNEHYLTLSYRQRSGGYGTVGLDYTVDGIRYTALHSQSLSEDSWTPGNFSVIAISAPNAQGIQTVTLRLDSPVNTHNPRFVRLVVSVVP